MKKKFNKAKEGVKGFFRPRSRQSVLATPERSRGSSQEPAAAHDQEMPTAPPPIFSGNRQLIISHANAVPGHDTLALKVPTPEPSPRPEDTSGVAAADTQLHFEPSTHATIRSAETQVVEITQDVKELATQRQEVDDKTLIKKHEKAIPTGQALLSLCSFERIAYTS